MYICYMFRQMFATFSETIMHGNLYGYKINFQDIKRKNK